MKILDIRFFRGPNNWSVRYTKLVAMTLDLEELEERPTNTIDGFYERLKQLLPSLYTHQCSEGRPGGFFFRVQDGTWMGHVIEHIALEIQALAGIEVGFGRTRGAGPVGVYNVIFAYSEERAGYYAAGKAVEIAQALIDNRPIDLDAIIARLKHLYESDRMGPSTSAIVEACVRKGVPFIRLDNDSYVQLGYGARQKRIEATMSSRTGAIGVEIADNKSVTKQVLEAAGIPVPMGEVVQDESGLQEVLRSISFPLTVKPLDGNHGRGVMTNIRTTEELFIAYHRAREHSDRVVVEQFITGDDYRLLVVDYKLVAAARRVPAQVTGDGVSTVRELIDQANQDPRRGDGHLNVLTKIVVDECSQDYLKAQNLTLDSVIPAGKTLSLKQTANLSTGGTSVDITDLLHPEVAFMAERVARTVGLDICGVDVIAEDLTLPLKPSGAVVIEVNAAPGLRMHTHPSEGTPRPVGEAIAEMLFPGDENGRIPVIAITGTNGKTTTTRLTAHLFRHQGKTVGFTTTEGVYIGNFCIEEGDCTGPISARKVLTDSSVEVAVLECARGGMLRSGLAFEHCDVGVVTNVAADHLGLNGIHTVEDMARVKSVIPETVRSGGYAVLNADEDHTYGMRERVSCRVALFSRRPDSERIVSHLKAGGLAAVYEDGFITIRQGDAVLRIERVEAIPLAFGGKATFMVENILAATLAAYCQGMTPEAIADGLRTFEPSSETTPGRMNWFKFREFSILVDYAHNPHGLRALAEYIQATDFKRKTGIITGVGDRRDEDIRELGTIAGGMFDEVVIRLDEDARGRPEAEIIQLVSEGIRSVDPQKPIQVVPDECEALKFAVNRAEPGTLIVHLTEKIAKSVSMIRSLLEQEGTREPHEELVTC
ncbi:cyanophycin synthetase [Larkinella soli]|uniref:cyanophycin synthetase n=1 Tax=Larkinella soli TaxID=1770527 RepID=UPI000FFC21F3|nr:cyanophycin synthetase [Larkinella soli]